MNPIHHPACNDSLRPPIGISEDQCRTLHIYRDPDSVASFWKPEPAELEHLVHGGSVILRILGITHPPLSLRVSPAGDAATTATEPPLPQFILTTDEFIQLNKELEEIKAWQKNEFDSGDDSLFNVRRLRSYQRSILAENATLKKTINHLRQSTPTPQTQTTLDTELIPSGICTPLPLVGFPAGRIRVRMREDELVRIFVKSLDGLREFIPIEQDGTWIPWREEGRNLTASPPIGKTTAFTEAQCLAILAEVHSTQRIKAFDNRELLWHLMNTEAWHNFPMDEQTGKLAAELESRLYPEYDADTITWQKYGWSTPEGNIFYRPSRSVGVSPTEPDH